MATQHIPVVVDGHTILVAVAADGDVGEQPVSAHSHAIEPALEAAAATARAASRRFLGDGCDVVTVEVGLEFALESGRLVAVFGKATTKTTFKVTATFRGDENT